MMCSHLLGLDIDGVLHRGDDVLHLPQGVHMPMWQVEVAMKAQGRFVWCDLLEEALGDSPVGIVIHSTWRRRFADSELAQLLSPGLARRVIRLDGQISSRL
ncbi:MAG: hypothetical protein K2W33_04545, partial [Burkholderiales bacterium]|nr:hypothetical protein [Burkholderiales bacterium]